MTYKRKQKNIYEMYYANKKKYGFYVRRISWGNTIAKVISIENVNEGEGITGQSPYYNNPKVMAEFYKGEKIEDCNSLNVIGVCEISCPGTFSYRLLKENKKVKAKVRPNTLKQIYEELMAEQEEIISSPIRFNGVHIQKIQDIFSKYGIDTALNF